MGNESDIRTMSLTIPGIVRRTNDILYGTSALVPGLDVGEPLTRDGDIWDSAGTVAFANERNWKTLYTPIVGETGKVYTMMFDGTYYHYQEWIYNRSIQDVSEVSANRLGSASGLKALLGFASYILYVQPDPYTLFTGSVAYRIEAVKP